MRWLFFMLFAWAIFLNGCTAQQDTTEQTIVYSVNSNVRNAEEDYFVEIRNNWENYLNADAYISNDGPYWNHETYTYPEMGYVSLLMYLRGLRRNGGRIQCSIVGIVPVQKDFYLLKSIFTQKQAENEDLVDVKFIVSVYAKKKDDTFQFYSGTQYYKETLGTQQVGNIQYIVHPEHPFDEAQALKMNQFNQELSKRFELPPLEFDYVVANDTRDLCDVFGLNFFAYSYQPVASGGMADTYNRIIYAGNNSEYYPHELVHLYTSAKYRGQYHTWIDEGIAAYLGGSTGYKIEWHWEKVRRFLVEQPDYPMNDLTALQTDVPNGEYTTDFRYAIGALICQKILEKEGMAGIFDALQAGRTEEDYFRVLESKLGLKRADFEAYIKAEFLKLSPIADADLEKFKY